MIDEVMAEGNHPNIFTARFIYRCSSPKSLIFFT
jgi:hypothetical protein